MIIIDQLKISDDCTKMYLNAHVNTASYFDNAYIDSVTIMTAEKVSETAPGIPTTNYIYTQTFDDNLKEIDLVLSSSDFVKSWETTASSMKFTVEEMGKTLFFVYIKLKYVGSPDPCIPCDLDKEYTVGVTFNRNVPYKKGMDYTKELLNDCSVPQNFIDFILLWNALKLAILTGHYIMAIKYFNLLFDNATSVITKSCNCNG